MLSCHFLCTRRTAQASLSLRVSKDVSRAGSKAPDLAGRRFLLAIRANPSNLPTLRDARLDMAVRCFNFNPGAKMFSLPYLRLESCMDARAATKRARADADSRFERHSSREANVERGNANLQSDFLGALMANRTPVWVFLVNGIKLSGVIAAFDKFAVSVRSPSGTQLINKSAISTVIEQHAHPVAPTRVPTDRPRRWPPGGQS